nr:translation initiation factor IF-3 [Siccirubricoccus soli]
MHRREAGPISYASPKGEFPSQPQETTIARGPIPNQPPTRDGPRVNEEIRVPQVRLIDQNGEMIGVMSARDALLRAYEVGMDLLEISPNAVPPVCKITDYGKYKYEQQKKANEARKKQKVVEIKEVKVRPNIDDHDYDVKMRQMKSFIGEGDKVKVTLRFRGREMAHQDLGIKVLERIRTELGETIKVEQMPRLENRQMIMVLAPK